MSFSDVVFRELFASYVIPISALIVVVVIIKGCVRRFHLKFRSNLSQRISDAYEKATFKHKQKLFEQLHQLSRDTDRPLKILELNVGFGDNFKYYPGGCDVVCLDPDPDCEDYIRNTASDDYPQLRFLDFVVGGAEILRGLPDSCLDAVIITHGLCADVDPAKTIEDIYRILKKGGRLLLLNHTRATRWSLVYTLQLLIKPVYVVLRINCDVRIEITKLLQNCPFERTENEFFQLDMAQFSFAERLCIPIWSRVHIASAATK